MKVLVTGAAGFIGANVVKILENKGAQVYALDDFSSANFKNLEGAKAEVVCADVCDEKAIAKLPAVDAVIHEAAITDTTFKDDKKMIMVNFEGFKNIFNFAARKKAKLVYISSAAVYGSGPSPMKETQKPQPLNAYAYSKYLCDCFSMPIMKKKILPLLLGIRYFNVYGPGEHHKGAAASMIYQLYLQMKAGKRPCVFKFGEQKRDFIYVLDAARITVDALVAKTNTIVNVGTGKARSFNDIISAINTSMKTNLEPDYFDNPYVSAYQNLTEADITHLKKVIKNPPQYSLEDGISDYVKNHLLAKQP
ncbi:MAG: ADP-glyceromanno-heptose 6-epimerase [Candidatus Omnitrophica bacterium]|nr:ADP-glyceromanno-heptose 6-epimerase [Candidatus Omnitrophota bacterium]